MTKPAMKCDIYQDAAGGWRWRLRARNSRVIADGAEAYSERRKAADAVQRLADAAGDLSLFEVLQQAVDAARRRGDGTADRARGGRAGRGRWALAGDSAPGPGADSEEVGADSMSRKASAVAVIRVRKGYDSFTIMQKLANSRYVVEVDGSEVEALEIRRIGESITVELSDGRRVAARFVE